MGEMVKVASARNSGERSGTSCLRGLHHIIGNAAGTRPRHQAFSNGDARYLATLHQGQIERMPDAGRTCVQRLAQADGTSAATPWAQLNG